MDKPPFDTTKATFFLIAFVIGVYCTVALVSVAFCFVHYETEQIERCGNLRGQVVELLAGALAAALAFAAGFKKG